VKIPAARLAALAWIVAAAMVASVVAAERLRPTVLTADLKAPIVLEAQIPKAFEGWTLDESLIPLLPSPDVQEMLDSLYSQVLARTYVNATGERVMLTIAYGRNQNSEETAAHRPEFCYGAQGFKVKDRGTAVVPLSASKSVLVRHLRATLGERLEPISYWVTLDEAAALPGLDRKLQQIRYGLSGRIADGMLVRVSTIDLDEAASYRLQGEFLAALYGAVAPQSRGRYFGS
jgi:EpsI family protein